MYHFVQGQGSRDHMEDRFSAPDIEFEDIDEGKFYAVFDGHGGSEAAEYCARTAQILFFALMEGYKGDVMRAMGSVFFILQEKLAKIANGSGTTATCLYVKDNIVVTANVGDSDACIWQGDTITKLTACHRAGSCPKETLLVEQEGGFIRNGRVYGMLSITRALGDFDFYPAVQPAPFISRISISDPNAFIILASDGLWDSIEPAQIPELVNDSGNDVVDMAYRLGAACKKSHDNYTVGVISLEHLTDLGFTH